MTAISHLPTLLATMQPRLSAESFVFCALPDCDWMRVAALDPVVVVREIEALTVVVTLATAKEHGLPTAPAMRRITLDVHSDLEAVGLTAAFAAALTEAGISANVVAGYHHDHIFVPDSQAEGAMRALEALQARAVEDTTV
ncbi:ACT domain-containing protein [uncultured Brevundimonas sp.]|uniref:ACT domain-containing protein n=1 Tax=uncultured Brevundimonas sp. TaxID=213418 RepID=UPI0030EC7503|tara:strand:- start:1364 stop:1786 length:423 start_codon:yes stop_codon:yes gene_type:complete